MESQIKFSDLWLSEKTLKYIEAKGYKEPSPIQAWVIPLLLNWDKDIIGQAQTGTGKTAAFALPILERLDEKSENIQTLILAPTRELAIQVAEEIKSFAWGTKIQLLYWGQNIRTELAGLRQKPQIVVWTPGRVIDHLIKRRTLDVKHINYFVLDEADEMLNIWFKEEIEEIIKHTPKEKKVLLFSATMPKAIKDIVGKYIKEHDFVSIKKEELTNKNIVQKCFKVSPRDKFEALCRVIEIEFDFYWIIFCKTKADVDEVASKLMTRGYKVEGIHGDIEQKQREKTLTRFKNKTITILVATDVAARWIDVNNLTHVINYSLPDNPETYTHRIWRTGRAGNKWEAISFVSRRDTRSLIYIERIIKQKIKVEKLPNVKQVIEFKKKGLINNIKEIIDWETWEYYLGLAKQMLDLWSPEKIISALLKESYDTQFDEEHYIEVKEEVKINTWWQMRLFIAKGRNDNMSPWTLIQFLEKEVGEKLWDIWRIEVLREFSFMNVSADDAELILAVFKKKNPRKPLVVQAKEKPEGSSQRRSFNWNDRQRGKFWERKWGYTGRKKTFKR